MKEIKCPNGCKHARFIKLHTLNDLVYRPIIYNSDGTVVNNRKSDVLEERYKCCKCGKEFTIKRNEGETIL